MAALWGVYDSVTQVQEIVQKLRDMGITRDALTVVMVTTSSKKTGTDEKVLPPTEQEATPATPVAQPVEGLADLDVQSSYSVDLLRILPGLGVSKRDAAVCVRRAHAGSVVVVVDYKGSDPKPVVEILQSVGHNRSERVELDMTDVLMTEQQIMGMIGRQLRNSRIQMYGDVTALINRIDFVLKDHNAGLRRHLGTTDTPAATFFQQASEIVMGLVASATDRLRGDSVSSTLCEDYKALSLAAMKYTKLHTTALAKYDHAVADLALRHLQDLTQILVSISKLIPVATDQELRDVGEVADGAPVGTRALENTQQAWSTSNT